MPNADYWKVGSRFYFKRDTANAKKYPIQDLGVLTEVSPSFDIQTIRLQDSYGGVLKTVAEGVSEYNEAYDLTLRNMSPWSLQYLFSANPPSEVTTAFQEFDVAHSTDLFVGQFLRIQSSTGTWQYPLASIAGIYVGTLASVTGAAGVTAIVASTRTFTVGTNLTAILAIGDRFILSPTGLANVANAGTYQISSLTASTIVTVETPVANETAVQVKLSHGESSPGATLGVPVTDWSVESLDEGLLRTAPTWAIPGGSLDTPITVRVVYAVKALTGRRLLLPQTAASIVGEGALIFGREGNTMKTVRQARYSLVPQSMDTPLPNSGYASYVIRATVISDLTAVEPAGVLRWTVGDVPTPT